MGPNGSGKSTLAYVLAGKADYTPTSGEVLFDGKNIFDMQPDERAAAGLFLAFQYPLEIPGVATMTFLRTALNAQRKKRGDAELSTPQFIKKVRDVAGTLGIDQDMLRRAVNVGFSGGEKKRNEILQMALLEPRLAVLDETDSGLDIDALKIVADGVNRLRAPTRSFVVITHYQRLLELHRARRGARAVAWPHRENRRQGTGARARSARLRASIRKRCWRERRSRHHQDRGGDRAGAGFCAGARSAARATMRSRRNATPRSTCSPRRACRTAASRNGNIPTCAR